GRGPQNRAASHTTPPSHRAHALGGLRDGVVQSARRGGAPGTRCVTGFRGEAAGQVGPGRRLPSWQSERTGESCQPPTSRPGSLIGGRTGEGLYGQWHL